MPDDPTADALAQADAIVQDSVTQADAIVQDSLAQADAIVQDSVAQADAIVQDSVAQADAIVRDSVTRADAIVQDSVTRADAIVQDSVTRADAIVDETPGGADHAVDDGFAEGMPTPTGQDAGAQEGVEAASSAPPVTSDHAVAAPTGGDASLSRFDGDPTSAGPPDVLLGTGPFAESGFAGPPDAVPVEAVSIDAAPAPAVGDGSGLDAMVASATDPAVITAAGVAVLVGGGLQFWRGAPQLPEAPIVFTNVRLLPCLIRDSLADQLGAIASALSRRGGETATHVVIWPSIAPPQDVVAEASASNPPANAGGQALLRFGASFREGFGNAVEGKVGAAVVDSRLLMQLGMALGCVYAAFLSVWFWATRVHRSGGA